MKFENSMDNFKGRNLKEVGQEKEGEGELRSSLEQVGQKAKENPEELILRCGKMEEILNGLKEKYPQLQEEARVVEFSMGACLEYIKRARKEGHEIVFKLSQ